MAKVPLISTEKVKLVLVSIRNNLIIILFVCFVKIDKRIYLRKASYLSVTVLLYSNTVPIALKLLLTLRRRGVRVFYYIRVFH